jgi:hypothetical protein
MDDLEMFLNIYNNWPNDAHVGSFPSSIENTLMDENEDAIASHRLLDMDENNFRVYVFLFFSSLKSFFLSKFDVCVHQS